MKKIKILILLLIPAAYSFGQQMLPTEKQVNTFLHSRTYFVYDNNIFGMYNTAIEEAANKHWKITDFDFINKDEFKKKIKVPTASMVVETESHFEGQEELGVFTSLSLILGKPGGNINTVPDIITVPMAYNDVDYDNYYYKLGLALLFMQNHVQWLKNNPHVEDKVLINHYKNSKKSTKGKTLWLLKNEMAEDVNTIDKIKQVYDGDVKFVTKEDIKDAVDNKNEDVIILHLVAPSRNIKGNVVTKMILGAADADIYYFDFHRIKGKKKPNKFLKSDFEAINKI
ncbi:MAG: hypothetical protein GXO50_10610 [Chlorobi bacterium]|nr:hypothetical protein [Chlorobiota bacterium]